MHLSGIIDIPENRDFLESIPDEMTKAPWYFDGTKKDGLTVRLLGHCSSNCISCETFSTGFSVRLVPF
jgi:hypothetical protein